MTRALAEARAHNYDAGPDTSRELSLVALDYGVRMFPVRVDILDDVGAGTVRLLLLIVLGCLHVVVHRVLHIAIDLLGSTLHLVDDALIGELLIADGFTDSL